MRLPKQWKRLYITLRVKGRQFYKKYRNEFKGLEVELYDLNQKLHPYFRGLSLILMVLALVSLIASLGFELPENYRRLNDYLDLVILLGFASLFLSRLFFTSRRWDLIKSRILEAIPGF